MFDYKANPFYLNDNEIERTGAGETYRWNAV